MAKKIYQEKQRFNDKLVFVLLIAGMLGTAYGAVSYLFDPRTSLTYALVSLAVCLALGVALWSLTRVRYKVSIDRRRIKYKLAPLHRSSRKIPWKEVESCKLVRTPRTAQFHHDNYRFGEEYCSISGRNGLAVTTKSGQRYFVGCEDPEALRSSLSEVKQLRAAGVVAG